MFGDTDPALTALIIPIICLILRMLLVPLIFILLILIGIIVVNSDNTINNDNCS